MTHGTNFLATFARAFVALTALSLGLAIVGCGRGGTPDRDSASASVGGAASAGRAPASGAHFRTQKAPPEPALRYLTFQLGGAREEEELPLLIAVHGLGDTPQNFSRWLLSLDLKLRLVVPEAPDPYGHGYSWFPYREHRTEHELATGIAASRDRLERLLEQLERRFPTRGKPAVLGFSQGGMLSFALAAHTPERWSLVMPLGGLLPRELEPAPMATPQTRPEVVAFHGTEDRLVPFAAAKATSERLSKLGYVLHFHSYPGVGHQIPPSMRDAVFARLKEWAEP